MDEAIEVLDLVDQSDEKIGTILRKDIKTLFESTVGYVRYANCFLQNSRGELWIPTRAPHKKIAPNGLDFSASEHVQAGENYDDAIVRGLYEELNLIVDISALSLIGKLMPSSDRPYFSSIHILASNESPTFNHDDFTEYNWMTPKELLIKIDGGHVAKADLAPAVKLLAQ